MKKLLLPIIAILFLVSCAQEKEKQTNEKEKQEPPEKQISFALEEKSHDYYVEQAKLWWLEIEKDRSSEENWFNYYRACRNAQGTADWREDFVEESPYLRLGNDIVELMEKDIPNTFTYNFVRGSTGAVDPSQAEYLLKAYEMNPDYPGIQASMVTYATSTHNPEVRKEANLRWKNLDLMNPGLLNYSRSVLQGVDYNAVLLTQHDNDSYPAWMLQDAYGVKTGVLVLNIDFLLLESFREKIFSKLGIPPFQLDSVSVNDYRKNWKNVVQHLLGHYSHERPLFIGMTVSPQWYEGFEDQLSVRGLTYKFGQDEGVETLVNVHVYENVWDVESINQDFEGYYNRKNVLEMNANYVKPFTMVYDYYTQNQDTVKAEKIKKLGEEIIKRAQKELLIEAMVKQSPSQ